jgi:hypothetical protein
MAEMHTAELAKINKLIESASKPYDVQLDLQKSRTAVVDQEVSLMEKLNFGVGVSLQMRSKQLSMLMQERKIVEDSIRAQAANLKTASTDERPAIEKKLNDLQSQRLQIVQKEVDLSKDLREGYLQAIQDFEGGAGRFSKIIAKQDFGTRQLLGAFGSRSAMALGGMGQGLTTPGMQYTAAGLTGAAPGEKQLQKMYGVQPQAAIAAQAMANARGLGTGVTTGAEALGAIQQSAKAGMVLSGNVVGMGNATPMATQWGSPAAATAGASSLGPVSVNVQVAPAAIEELSRKIAEAVKVKLQKEVTGGTQKAGVGDSSGIQP